MKTAINQEMLKKCRLCQMLLGECQLFVNKSLLSTFIMKYTKISVNKEIESCLPQNVCLSCKKSLEEFDKFVEHVQSVDSHLKSLLDLRKIKDLKNDPISSFVSIEEVKSYACDKCPASFTDFHLFKVHLDSHEVSPKYQCPICLKTYNRQQNFDKHRLKHTGLKKNKCEENRGETKCQLRSVKSSIKDESSECSHAIKVDDCKKESQTNQKLTHLVKQTDVNQINDNVVDEIITEVKTKNFVCIQKDCSKVCDTYDLKGHLLKHEKKRTFLCITCGKDFFTKNSLNCHEKIHLDVKAYVCKICNVEFSVRSNLRSHEKKYHEGVRFYCSQCTRSFLNKCSLERHEKTHLGLKDFKCDSCKATFYTNKELLKHSKYHQGIRQHKCEHCFKTFFERHHLTIHLRIHSGERPYVCDILGCKKSFNESQKLKKHRNTKHVNIKEIKHV